MSQFQTRVHVAGPIDGNVQRCSRCGAVLIDSTGAMSIDGARMAYWRDGAWVGMVEVCDDSLPTRTVCSFAMQEDAWKRDEIQCGGQR